MTALRGYAASLLASLLALTAVPAHADPIPPERTPEVATQLLEPLALQTFTATVKEVRQHLIAPGTQGLDLSIDVGGRTLLAHLGPAAFIHPKMRFSPGDTLELRAAPIPGEPVVALLTISIKKNGKRLVLRTEKGAPLYSLPATK